VKNYNKFAKTLSILYICVVLYIYIVVSCRDLVRGNKGDHMFMDIIKWCGWLVALGALLVNFCTTNPPPQPEKEDSTVQTEETTP